MDVGNILHFLRGESGAKPIALESGETGRDFSSLLQILRGVLPPRRSDAVAEAGVPPSPAPFQAVADRSARFASAALTDGEDSAGLVEAVNSVDAASLAEVEDAAGVAVVASVSDFPDEAIARAIEAESAEAALKEELAPAPEAVESDVQVLASASLPGAPAATPAPASSSAPAPNIDVNHAAPSVSDESVELTKAPALRPSESEAERRATPAPSQASAASSAPSEMPAPSTTPARQEAFGGEASNAATHDTAKDTATTKGQRASTSSQSAAPDGASPVVVESDAQTAETSSAEKESSGRSTSTPATSAPAQSDNDTLPQVNAARPEHRDINADPAAITSNEPGAARQSDARPAQASATAPTPGRVENTVAEDQLAPQGNAARAGGKNVDHADVRNLATARHSTAMPETPGADETAPATTPRHQPEVDIADSRPADRPVEDGPDAAPRVHRNVWAYAASRRAAAPRPDVITDTRSTVEATVRESLGSTAQNLQNGDSSTTLPHIVEIGARSATSPAEAPRHSATPQVNAADQPLQPGLTRSAEAEAAMPTRSAAADAATTHYQAAQTNAQAALPATESSQAPITPVVEPSPEPQRQAASVAVENAVDTTEGIQVEQRTPSEVVPETAVEPEAESRGDGNASGRHASGDGLQKDDQQRGNNTASADVRAARPGSTTITDGGAPSAFEVDGKTLRQENRTESPTVETPRATVASVESESNSTRTLPPRTATSPDEAGAVAPLDTSLDGQSLETTSPEELRLADATADRSARTDTTGAAAPRTFSAASSARASLAWLDAVMQRPAAFHTEANGTQVLRLELEDDDGAVTLRARRDGERMLVNVSFTDPTMQASAESQGDEIRSALQQLFESGIDLSFSHNDDARQNLQEANRRSTGSSGRASVSMGDDDSRTSRTRTMAVGARHEWVG